LGEHPLLSIAIPVFNGAGEISRTLRALGGLKDASVEVLISDNASEDGTVQEVETFTAGSLISMKIYKQQSNLGFRGNLKFLTSMANGDFIWFLGAGDSVSAYDVIKVLENIALNSETSNFVLRGEIAGQKVPAISGIGSTNLDLEPFDDAVSCNIIKRTLVLELPEVGTGNSWPHIEAALLGHSRDCKVIRDDAISIIIFPNKSGWWYQSPLAWQIYLDKVWLIAVFQRVNGTSSWSSNLLHKMRGSQFGLMIFETRKNDVGFSSKDLTYARYCGIALHYALAARVANFVPAALFRASSTIRRKLGHQGLLAQ